MHLRSMGGYVPGFSTKHISTVTTEKNAKHIHINLTLSIHLSLLRYNFTQVQTLIIFLWNVWFILQLYSTGSLLLFCEKSSFQKFPIIFLRHQSILYICMPLFYFNTNLTLRPKTEKFTRKIIRCTHVILRIIMFIFLFLLRFSHY